MSRFRRNISQFAESTERQTRSMEAAEEEADSDYVPNANSDGSVSESFEDSDASTDSDFIGDDEIPHHLNNQEAKEFWKATLNGAAPEQHALSAKRKIGRGGNKGTGRVKKSRHNKSDPTGVSGKDIVVKFPNEPLMLVDGKPHCKACHCPVAFKL
jgi:hypothetical protein